MLNREVSIKKKTFWKEYGLLTLYAVAFFVLLLLRDAYSVQMNKYILLALACVGAVTLPTGQLIGLYTFLFPLYVGLPGNYMTLLLIARLLLDIQKLRIQPSSLLLTVGLCGFVLIQNVATDHTGMVPMVYIAGIVLILLLLSYRGELNTKMLITMFSAGVAALGFIMLTATLQVYELSELMDVGQRLGAADTDYVSSGIMNVSIDPNFYGLFMIAAVSTAVPYAMNKQASAKQRFCLLAFSVISVLVCLVGLSRAAVLILAVWLLLFVLFQRGAKMMWMILAVAILVLVTMPDVLDAIAARFEEDNMADGNGRISLIKKFFDEWLENPVTVLFGVGLFNCNVHCTPLQFLFGGGVVMLVLIVLLAVSFMSRFVGKFSFAKSLPFLVTFGMMLTIPAAQLLNCLFPLVYVGLLSAARYEDKTVA